MAKRPKVNGRQLIRVLEKKGFQLRRVRGSHHILYDASGRRAMVAVHGARAIPPGTVASILAQAGISDDEFRELLK